MESKIYQFTTSAGELTLQYLSLAGSAYIYVGDGNLDFAQLSLALKIPVIYQ
jgi:hypothetical protein